MTGHFDAIGFALGDRETFGRTISELSRTGQRASGPGGTRVLWQDDSGARVAIFVESGSIECAKPTFDGDSRLVVRPGGTIEDPGGCRFCAIASVEVLEGDEMAYPIAVELDDLHEGLPTAGTDPVTLAVTAFSERMELWSDVAAYEKQPAKAGGMLAAQSLIPSGLFSPGGGDRPARAEAIITGIVTAAERKTNSLSGLSFEWCLLDTYAAVFDVVAPERPESFSPGQVVQGTFWLVGHRVGRVPNFDTRRRHGLFRRGYTPGA